MSSEKYKGLPFSQTEKNGKKIRIFKENISSEELMWHFDDEDRIISPLNKTNWKLQMDNCLPLNLEKGKTYYISEGRYHRLIKGDGELHLEVKFKKR